MTVVLKLYVAGATRRSVLAERNLRSILKQSSAEIDLEVIDVLQNPEQAVTEGLVAVPALVKTSPLPRRKVIGDLPNKNVILEAIGLKPTGTSARTKP